MKWGFSVGQNCKISIYILIDSQCKGQIWRFYCIPCTTVKTLWSCCDEKSQSKVYQGGRVFLAVGVGDYVFACKIDVFRFPCLLSPCALSKTTSGQSAVNILLNCADHVRMLFDYHVLKIDAELFSERKHGPKINAVIERCFKLMLFNDLFTRPAAVGKYHSCRVMFLSILVIIGATYTLFYLCFWSLLSPWGNIRLFSCYKTLLCSQASH